MYSEGSFDLQMTTFRDVRKMSFFSAFERGKRIGIRRERMEWPQKKKDRQRGKEGEKQRHSN